MMLQAPLRYKIEGGYLWTKFGSKETWKTVYYVGNQTELLPINQRFGANATPVYANLGYKGHMGTDWLARNYTCVYSPCDAVVTKVTDLDAVDPDSGTMGKIELEFTYEGNRYRWIAIHLSDSFVKVNDVVRANQLIGLTGNTGGPQVTTGSHLHTGLYPLDKSGNVTNAGNGYGGAIDDFPFYEDCNAYKSDDLKNLFDYAKSQGDPFTYYFSWGGSERFENAKKKLNITGTSRSRYANHLIKRLFN